MTQTNLRTTIEYIESRLSRDAYSEVIAHCRHVLNRYPKNLDAYRFLARALVEQEKHTDAMDLFQRILSADPNDFVAHVGISECYREANALEPAIWHLERAFEQVPNNAGLQDEIRRLYEIKGLKPPRKIRLTAGALARLYAKGSLYPQAIKELEKAITQDPERLDLQVLLADVLWRSDNVVQAGRVAGEVIKRLPYCLEANRILAQLWLRAGKPAEALPFINRARECDPYLAYRLEHSGREAPPDAITIDPFNFAEAHRSAAAADADWVADLDQLGSIRKEKGITGALAGASITDVFREETPAGVAPAPSAPAGGEDAPDWLKSALRGTAGLHSSSSPSESEIEALLAGAPSSAPAAGSDPDWMSGLFDTAPGVPPMGATPAAGLPAPDLDAPDWLRDAGVVPPGAPKPPAAPAPGSSEPDWLRDVLSEETPPGMRLDSPPPPAPGRTGMLAALKAVDPNEAPPDWLLESAQTVSAGSPPPGATPPAGTDAPDWLLDAMATGSVPPVSGGDPLAMPGPDEVTGAWPRPVPPGESVPDWLAEATSAAPAQPPGVASESWLDEMLKTGPAIPQDTPPRGTEAPSMQETGSVPRALIGGLETWDDDEILPAPPATPGDRSSMPDWLRQAAEVDQIAGSGENKQTVSQSPLPKTNELPDWLKAGMSPEAEPPPPGPLSEPDTQEDLPDWLKGGVTAPAAPAAEPLAQAAPASAIPPAQEGAVGMSDEPEKMDIDWDSDDALAWLEELAAELDPNFKASGGDAAPEAEEKAAPAAESAEELPEWLTTGPESEAAAPAAPAPAAASAADEEEEEEGLPDWLVSDSPAAKAAAAESTEEAEEGLPDWLTGESAPAAAQAAPAASASTSEDLPDWLKSESAAPAASAKDEDDDLAWLREPEEPAKAATSAAEAEGLPEWLTEETAKAEPVKAPEAAKAEAEPASDALAWLDEKVAEQGVSKDAVVSEALTPDRPPVSAPAVPPPDARAEAPSEEELPDWLKGVDTEAAIASAPAERVREPELDDFSDVKVEEEELAWLNEALPDKVSDDVDLDALFGEKPAAAKAASDEGLPAWLTGDEEKPAATPATESKPAADEEALPAWLAGDEKPAAAADEGLPAWLTGDEEKPAAAPAAESKPAADEEALPAWLAGDEKPAAAADEGLPAWLTGEPEKPAAAPVASTPAADEEALPAWLAGDEKPAAAADDEGLPAWLTGEPAAASRETLMPRAEEPAGAVSSEESAEAAAPATGTAPLPAWATSSEPADAGLESFLKAAEPVAPAEPPAAPAPAPVTPPSAPVSPPPAAPAPAPSYAAPVAPRVTGLLPEPPAPFSGDFAAQLARARSEMEQGNKVPSLQAYDSLVGAREMLDEVIEDLNGLISRGPVDSKVHRMLGDALMSKGRLQEALDQYRRALDQL